jgi:NTE family protein
MPSERAMSSMSMAGGLSPFGAIERCPLFAGLERSDLLSVGMSMRPRSLEPGEELYRAGDRGDRLFVIVAGLAQVIPAATRGEEAAPVAKLRRGDVTGATSLVTREPQAATVVAAAPMEVLELEREAFEDLTRRFPAILVNAIRILSRRLARSYARGAEESERGEAVGLIFGASLAEAADQAVEAAAAASPRPVASVDTRGGFHDAVARLDELLDGHGTVVVTARAEGRSAPVLLDHVDRAVALVEDESEAERVAGGRRLEVVLVGDGPSRPGSAPPVVRILGRDRANGPLDPGDAAWLGRCLSRTKLGLALGAGGAKGYAHVGALQVLEQAGYAVDCVAGSSIGAIVGAYLALGMDAPEIERTLRDAFDPDTVAEVFQLSLSGASTGLERITEIFRETTGARSFDDVLLPLVVMSVDLTERAPAPLRQGALWEALLAATALAGMFPPHERDGHRLVDGLALVPVPTGSVYEEGADLVVSVNLMPRETLPAWPGQPPPPPKERKRKGSAMLETILEVMDVSQLEDSNRHAELADVVVNPRFGPSSWRDFHLADLFLAAGREAMREQLPALEALASPQSASVSS